MSLNNLPPGVIMRDIDPIMVPCPECDGKGEYEEMFNHYGEDGYMMRECPSCGGSGEVPKTTIQPEKL